MTVMDQDASDALQRAIFSRLSGSTPFTIYDNVPHDAPDQYVTIGDHTGLDASDKLREGEDITFTVHTWDTSGGGKALTNQMFAAIHAAFGSAGLVVQGWTVRVFHRTFKQILPDPDGKTWHGVVRYRIVLDPVIINS